MGGPPVDGSENWWSSCESHDNMLRCGDKCCCQTGYVYEAKIGTCTQPHDQGMIPGGSALILTCTDVEKCAAVMLRQSMTKKWDFVMQSDEEEYRPWNFGTGVHAKGMR